MTFDVLNKLRSGYQLVDSSTGEKTYPRRASGLAKILEDQTNIDKWKLRQLTIAVGLSPDLLALCYALPHDDKKGRNQLVQDLLNRVPSAANLGTAVHAASEDADLNKPFNLPEAMRGDVRSYRSLMKRWGLEVVPEYIEATLVNIRLGCAGTTDRFLKVSQKTVALLDAAIDDVNEKRSKNDLPPLPLASEVMKPGDLIVADLKTGSSVQFGAASMPIQLHTYSSAELIAVLREGSNPDFGPYDLVPAPAVNPFYGLIAHTPATKGETTFHIADLRAAEFGAEAAVDAWQWRETTNSWTQTTLFRGGPLPVSRAKDPGDRPLLELISEVEDRHEAEALYHTELHRWGQSDTEAMSARLAQLG